MKPNRIYVLAATAVAAWCVAGCSGTSPDAAGPAVPTVGSSSASTASPSVPATGGGLPSSSDTTGQPATPPPSVEPAEPALSNECKAADLTLTLGPGEGAAGTVYRPLRFTNAGGRTCAIQGFPGVSYVAGDDGHQVGPAAYRVGTKGPAISLAPGATANAPVGFVQVGNFDPAVCQPTPVRGLRVYPPHDTAAMFVPMAGTGCAGTPPNPQLVVQTIKSGANA